MSGAARSPVGTGLDIREYRESDWPEVLPILQETYVDALVMFKTLVAGNS